MTANSTQRAAELSALIARHSTLPPHQIAAHVLHLQRIARQLHSIGLVECNGIPTGNREYPSRERTPAEQKAADTRAAKLEKRAGDLAAAVGGSIAVDRSALPALLLCFAGERGDGLDQASDGTGSYAVY